MYWNTKCVDFVHVSTFNTNLPYTTCIDIKVYILGTYDLISLGSYCECSFENLTSVVFISDILPELKLYTITNTNVLLFRKKSISRDKTATSEGDKNRFR